MAATLALAALAVGAPTTATATAPTSAAAATGCRATTNVLSGTPTRFTLPGGADVRVWDTGRRTDPLTETRIVAVRIPKGTLTPNVLVAPSIDTVRTPQQLATPVPKAVVVVNGSVFDPIRLGIPVETQMTGGVLRKATSSVNSNLVIWGTGPRLQFVNTHLVGAVRTSSAAWNVAGFNWQTLATSGMTVYSRTWGLTRHPAGPVAIVVSGGKVVAKRTGSATSLRAQTGQLIITAPKGSYATALSRLRVGTAVTVSMHMAGQTVWDHYPHVQMTAPTGILMAGGTIVRYAANVASCTGTGEDVRPRTVIGFMANGDLLVVAMSGHATVGGVRWGGATNHQAADYMLRLGAIVATKLDGGTSTTMLVRRKVGGPLVRMDRPASDYQRATPDSLSFLAP